MKKIMAIFGVVVVAAVLTAQLGPWPIPGPWGDCTFRCCLCGM